LQIAEFNLLHICLAPPLGWPIRISPRSLAWENYSSPWAIVWHCFCYTSFSRYGTVSACDGRTDGRTDTRRPHMPRC